MTEDSQLIRELERAGSRDEMQGWAHRKKGVEDTIFYRESLKYVKDYWARREGPKYILAFSPKLYLTHQGKKSHIKLLSRDLNLDK